jgi:hypothetical protein
LLGVSEWQAWFLCETLRAVQKRGNTYKDFFRSESFFLKMLIKKKEAWIDLKRVRTTLVRL